MIATLAVTQDTRATLDLVVTELVTNAVKHAHPVAHGSADLDQPIDLLITQTRDEVRVAVYDRGRGFSKTEMGVERDEGGLGLLIVNSLSTAWGVDCDGNGAVGCTVWCTIATEDAA